MSAANSRLQTQEAIGTMLFVCITISPSGLSSTFEDMGVLLVPFRPLWGHDGWLVLIVVAGWHVDYYCSLVRDVHFP